MKHTVIYYIIFFGIVKVLSNVFVDFLKILAPFHLFSTLKRLHFFFIKSIMVFGWEIRDDEGKRIRVLPYFSALLPCYNFFLTKEYYKCRLLKFFFLWL